jgi:hypothetical protein
VDHRCGLTLSDENYSRHGRQIAGRFAFQLPDPPGFSLETGSNEGATIS